MLTQLIELRLSLFQGAALQAKPLAMRSKTLPFLRQLLRWNLTHGIECLGLGWGVREEFPRALALERALCEPLLACGPQQAATCITEAAFECVVGPRQARHVVAVKQAGPIAAADRVEVTAKRIEGWRDLGPPHHRVEIGAQLSRYLLSTPAWLAVGSKMYAMSRSQAAPCCNA